MFRSALTLIGVPALGTYGSHIPAAVITPAGAVAGAAATTAKRGDGAVVGVAGRPRDPTAMTPAVPAAATAITHAPAAALFDSTATILASNPTLAPPPAVSVVAFSAA